MSYRHADRRHPRRDSSANPLLLLLIPVPMGMMNRNFMSCEFEDSVQVFTRRQLRKDRLFQDASDDKSADG